MKLHTNSKLFKILPSDVEAITLWPFGVFFPNLTPYPRTIRHEQIHWKQQRETFGLFYPWYLIEWVIRWFNYHNISFEREAYENENVGNTYLTYRKPFEFLKYL
jgi:hypothetical protein